MRSCRTDPAPATCHPGPAGRMARHRPLRTTDPSHPACRSCPARPATTDSACRRDPRVPSGPTAAVAAGAASPRPPGGSPSRRRSPGRAAAHDRRPRAPAGMRPVSPACCRGCTPRRRRAPAARPAPRPHSRRRDTPPRRARPDHAQAVEPASPDPAARPAPPVDRDAATGRATSLPGPWPAASAVRPAAATATSHGGTPAPRSTAAAATATGHDPAIRHRPGQPLTSRVRHAAAHAACRYRGGPPSSPHNCHHRPPPVRRVRHRRGEPGSCHLAHRAGSRHRTAAPVHPAACQHRAPRRARRRPSPCVQPHRRRHRPGR